MSNRVRVESKWLDFLSYEIAGRVTPVVEVRSKQHGILLGVIKWYGAWRQFAFFPEIETLFNKSCLDEIGLAVSQMNAAQQARRKT